jgi:hypothetical protein
MVIGFNETVTQFKGTWYLDTLYDDQINFLYDIKKLWDELPPEFLQLLVP